jgi:transposase-like protein
MKEKKLITKGKITKTGRSYDDKIRLKIVEEITTGLLGHREASRKYGINRKSIGDWVNKVNLVTLLDDANTGTAVEMSESRQTKLLLLKIQELQKALEHSQLKMLALETMIEVAETDLNIKIRKKRGTKQS